MAHRKNGVTDEMIVDAYRRLGAGKRVAQSLGVGENTVYKVLIGNDVVTDGHQRLRFFDSAARQRLVTEYQGDISAAQLATRHGCSTYSVLSALRKANVEIRSAKPHMTEDERLELKELYESGLTFKEVARQTGRHENTVQKLMNDHYPEIVRSGRVGPGSPHWLGGRTYFHGYAAVWVPKDDPFAAMAHKSGYVPEHRLVVARRFKRPLTSTETVHHINGDRGDNRPENLELRQGKHGKNTVTVCLDCGSRNIGHAGLGKNG